MAVFNIANDNYFSEKSQFWHLTHINNIPNILKHGLYARDWLEVFEIPFVDITEPHKVERRRRLGLTIYVPFHFFPWNPFDIVTLLKKLKLEGTFCYVTLHQNTALHLQSDVTFDFPNMLRTITIHKFDAICIRHIDKIRANTDFTQAKNRFDSLGECLVPDIVKVENFSAIITASEDDKELVHLFASDNLTCPVIVKPGYFKMTKDTARWFLPKRRYLWNLKKH